MTAAIRGTRVPRVKICCIQSLEEAERAIRLGASAIGLVSEMPSGPGVIPEARIGSIARATPPGVASFLLTSRQDVTVIVEQQRRTRVNTLQLVDALPPAGLRELRGALPPGIAIVQVIHVTGEASIAEAESVAALVDALLLDSGNPSLAIKELGGTGRTHDWRLSGRIRDAVPVPVYLAGGLKPDNVKDAIEEVRPFGVDVCSGVRTDGRLDAAKTYEFIQKVQSQRA